MSYPPFSDFSPPLSTIPHFLFIVCHYSLLNNGVSVDKYCSFECSRSLSQEPEYFCSSGKSFFSLARFSPLRGNQAKPCCGMFLRDGTKTFFIFDVAE